MNKAKAIEVINSKDKNATRGLHKALGFDFEKPFYIEQLDTAFTVNKALKAATAAGFSEKNDMIILLCDDQIMNWREFNVVKLSYGGGYTVEPFDGYEAGLTRFYSKKDFEDKRKRGSLETYLVCQKSEYILPHHRDRYLRNPKYAPNIQTRYKFVEFWYSQTAKMKRTDNNGEIFEYYVYKGINADNYNDYFDKSGYCVALAREELSCRLKELKTNRRKNEYLQTDNAAKIDALAQLIEVKRKMLVDEFAAITDFEKLSEFREKLGWGGLYSVFKDFKDLKDVEAKRAYSSVEAFEYEYNDIMRTLAKI